MAKVGWMHHLARHAVACFLTRGDLWLSWEQGPSLNENSTFADCLGVKPLSLRTGCLRQAVDRRGSALGLSCFHVTELCKMEFFSMTMWLPLTVFPGLVVKQHELVGFIWRCTLVSALFSCIPSCQMLR